MLVARPVDASARLQAARDEYPPPIGVQLMSWWMKRRSRAAELLRHANTGEAPPESEPNLGLLTDPTTQHLK